MKKFLYDSWLGFELIQMKWFRKWVGGEYTKILILKHPDITMWVKGKPEPYLANRIKVIKAENH